MNDKPETPALATRMPGQPSDFYDVTGRWLGAVVPHPRIQDAWLAMLCRELTTADKPSGWYRYKTWRGAVARIERKIAEGNRSHV